MGDLVSFPYLEPTPAPQLSRPQELQVVTPCQPLDASACTGVMAALHSLGAPLTLELRASETTVQVRLSCLARPAEELERAIRGAAPAWDLAPADPPAPPVGTLRRVCLLERPGVPAHAPLRDVTGFGDGDPLVAILEAVQPLAPDEQLLVRYLLRPARASTVAAAQRELTRPAPAHRLIDLLPVLFGAGPRLPRFEGSLQRLLERRLTQPAFELLGVVALAGSGAARLESRARSLTSVFRGSFDAGYGGLYPNTWSTHATPDTLPVVWREDTRLLLVTTAELAALWHPPSSRVLVPGVTHLQRPTTLVPRQIVQNDGLLLGVRRQRGQEVEVRLPRQDLHYGHLAVLGATGQGKSTLVEHLLAQLAAAADRPALAVIDPHSPLVLNLPRRGLRPARHDDVVLLELGDVEHPIGLSFFQRDPDVPPDAHVEATFALCRLLFRDAWSETRMADAVWALTTALCQLPGSTLLDVPRLLTDANFRRRAAAQLNDPVAREWYADFDALSEAGRREVARPILYRLRHLYRAPAVRNILCQTSGPNFTALLDAGAIVLVSLAGPAIQAEADLLGELIIARLHLALLARLTRPQKQPRRLYLAVDESQRFRGAGLPILLAEGRKVGVSLVLSTQFLAGWSEQLAESVLGNIGTLVSFRCGPNDSRCLASLLKPFTPEVLENLNRHEAVAKLQVNGVTMPAFDFRTLPIDGSPDEEALARIRAHTHARYARPRCQVGAELGVRQPEPAQAWNRVDVDEE